MLVVVRVPDFDSAVPLLNAHHYGNDNNIFTRSGMGVREFVDRSQVNTIEVNLPIPLPMACLRFGSEALLFGEHGHVPEGLLEPHADHCHVLAGKADCRIGDGDGEVTLLTIRGYPRSLFYPAQTGFFSG